MTEYTLTTEHLQELYTHSRYFFGNVNSVLIAGLEFESWLAERDRQVAERAWDEGRRAQIAHVDEWVAAQIPNSVDGGYLPLVNPYRKEATGDWPPPKSRDEIRKGAIDEVAEALEGKGVTGD